MPENGDLWPQIESWLLNAGVSHFRWAIHHCARIFALAKPHLCSSQTRAPVSLESELSSLGTSHNPIRPLSFHFKSLHEPRLTPSHSLSHLYPTPTQNSSRSFSTPPPSHITPQKKTLSVAKRALGLEDHFDPMEPFAWIPVLMGTSFMATRLKAFVSLFFTILRAAHDIVFHVGCIFMLRFCMNPSTRVLLLFCVSLFYFRSVNPHYQTLTAVSTCLCHFPHPSPFPQGRHQSAVHPSSMPHHALRTTSGQRAGSPAAAYTFS
jgi:hypothetical protein